MSVIGKCFRLKVVGGVVLRLCNGYYRKKNTFYKCVVTMFIVLIRSLKNFCIDYQF